MPESRKIGIVAALEREIHPLITSYKHVKRSYQDRTYSFFESDRVAAVCGGIGPEAARRATEAMIAIYKPEMVVSAGFAGGLDYTLHIGDVFCPELVIDASDGSRIEAGGRSGQLVTFGSIAGSQQKAKLANAYQAQAVDMEAAAVGRAAGRHAIAFCVVKAISDEAEFEMPGLERFVGTGEGAGFRQWSFAAYVMFRPWLWGRAFQLGAGSAKAARALCGHLSALASCARNETVPGSVDLAMRTKC
jgi:adenosylhomocysteine nucleosidase